MRDPPSWHADPLELANDKLKEMEAAAAMDENNAEAEEVAISADGKVKLSTGEFTIPQQKLLPLLLQRYSRP